MPDFNLYRSAPRDYALALVEDEGHSKMDMLKACLNYLSHDEVRDMLDNNEQSPRFFGNDDSDDDSDDDDDDDDFYGEDEISSAERNACDHYNERYATSCYD